MSPKREAPASFGGTLPDLQLGGCDHLTRPLTFTEAYKDRDAGILGAADLDGGLACRSSRASLGWLEWPRVPAGERARLRAVRAATLRRFDGDHAAFHGYLIECAVQ
jgi:hypothetical protein